MLGRTGTHRTKARLWWQAIPAVIPSAAAEKVAGFGLCGLFDQKTLAFSEHLFRQPLSLDPVVAHLAVPDEVLPFLNFRG